MMWKRIWLAVLALCLVMMPAAARAESAALEDGEYRVDVTLEGGSGRSGILSPAVLLVQDGQPYIRIEWDSSHYDYMKVEDETYLPVNEEGNSVFEIPVPVFDEPVTVIGDTTAMSVPHEIEYTLTVDSASVSRAGQASWYNNQAFWICAAAAAAVLAAAVIYGRRKRKGV